MFYQEFVSCKKRKPVNLYPILILKIQAFMVDLWGDYGYFISFLLKKGCNIFNEDTMVGGIEVGISIGKEED